MNNELYDNKYKIPEKIMNNIKTKIYSLPHSDGIKRAKNLVKNGYCTYQSLKRLKNFFDRFDSNKISTDQYELAGGILMKNFVEKTLQLERIKVANSKKVKQDLNVNLNDPTKKAQSGIVDLNESENKFNRSSVVIILDNENRILLLKRSSYPDQWQPNKLNLVGGAVDVNEQPIEAAKREVMEETGIKLENIIEKFVIQRNENNIEHLFVSKLPKKYNNYDISLDKENDGYIWSSYNEIFNMKKDQLVPNLLDYIRIAVENYD